MSNYFFYPPLGGESANRKGSKWKKEKEEIAAKNKNEKTENYEKMPVQHEESYIYRNGIVVCFLRGGVALFLFFGYEGVGRGNI